MFNRLQSYREWDMTAIFIVLLIVIAIFGVSCCDNKPIEISIIYAPEEELYLVDAIEQFNQTYEEGRHPLTGESLGWFEPPIVVTGTPGSSGEVAKGIADKIGIQNDDCLSKWSIDQKWLSEKEWFSEESFPPTIFSPSVRHWLDLVNYCTGQTVFDSSEEGSPATARAPVVIAIWESRFKEIKEIKEIKDKKGNQPLGWKDILDVLNSPNGWTDYESKSNHQTVYYSHADPEISSTALSTLIAEFYVSAGSNTLTSDDVKNKDVQDKVRDIEEAIRHYPPRSTEFKDYVALGPDYVDFVALEENDLIYINQGKTQLTPPEKLIALYPKEGTFWHDHPFAIPNADADWVSKDQRDAAKIFTEFVRSEKVQKEVLKSGFRPVIELEAASSSDPNINPILRDLGVEPDENLIATLPVLDAQVIASVQDSWQAVKKRADVMLVIDTSGSMKGDRLNKAKEAALAFVERMTPQSSVEGMPAGNRLGLISFSDTVNDSQAELQSLESNEGQQQIRDAIENLQADGETTLYDAIERAIEKLKETGNDSSSRIQAVVVLSDGQDTESETKYQELLRVIREGVDNRSPIIVIPVAYGYNVNQPNRLDCDALDDDPEHIQALQCIAQTSATIVQPGDVENIKELFELIRFYF